MTTNDQRGLCIDCNYPLHGLDSTRCPECGRPFDPADPNTMSVAASGVRALVENYRRRSGAPTRWLLPVSLALCIAGGSLNVVCLGDLGPPFIVMTAGHVALGVAYGIRRKIRKEMVRSNRLPPDVLAVDRGAVRRVHSAVIWTTFFLLWRLPFLVVFVLSLPLMNRTAERELHTFPVNLTPPAYSMLGPFPVRYTLVGHGGVDFEVVTGHALVYRPCWQSDHPGAHRHIVGPWFIEDRNY
jgi:hypothetical protein